MPVTSVKRAGGFICPFITMSSTYNSWALLYYLTNHDLAVPQVFNVTHAELDEFLSEHQKQDNEHKDDGDNDNDPNDSAASSADAAVIIGKSSGGRRRQDV